MFSTIVTRGEYSIPSIEGIIASVVLICYTIRARRTLITENFKATRQSVEALVLLIGFSRVSVLKRILRS